MERIALFDFCETIANFQTADRFVHYTRSLCGFFPMRVKCRIHSMLVRKNLIDRLSIRFPDKSINKRIILWQLRGVSKRILEKLAKSYYGNVIKQNLIPPVIAEMQSLKSSGYRIILVSGGYDIYLKYFAEEYGVDSVISSKIKFCGNACMGKLDGKDCIGNEKVEQLKKMFPNRDNIFFVAYSDSKSDIPMLEWADDAVVVRNNSKKPWTDKYREIIW